MPWDAPPEWALAGDLAGGLAGGEGTAGAGAALLLPPNMASKSSHPESRSAAGAGVGLGARIGCPLPRLPAAKHTHAQIRAEQRIRVGGQQAALWLHPGPAQ